LAFIAVFHHDIRRESDRFKQYARALRGPEPDRNLLSDRRQHRAIEIENPKLEIDAPARAQSRLLLLTDPVDAILDLWRPLEFGGKPLKSTEPRGDVDFSG